MATNPLAKQLSYHSFNSDGTQCAVSQNDEAVYMYATNGKIDPSEWELKQTVTEHGGVVSGIAWCAATNLIVTCGHDRNAYVWKLDDKTKQWKPTLVILRINRGATCVKWSPKGDKFAVGSGAKCVPVCHFEAGQNWWISKMIKKHKSSVLDLEWSPNQKFIVTGACDFKCRIFSAFIDGIDNADDDALTGMMGKSAHKFGECLMEFDAAKAWVQAVAWCPNGNRIAYAGHGSTLTFVNLADKAETTIYQQCLPTLNCFFIDDDNLISIGYDHNPTVYTLKGSEWVLGKQLDEAKEGETKAAGGSANKARNMFQNADTRGVAQGHEEQPAMTTKHQNTILGYCHQGGKKFSTSGIDGRLIQWTL